MTHEQYMQEAIIEARKAYEIGEIPVGAVIVKDGAIIGRGYNQKEKLIDPTSHAEIEAIKDASKNIKDWRLVGSTLYVTAEPCIMCSGAIMHARIDRVIFGVKERKFGGVVSHADILDIRTLNHRVEWLSGILEDEIADMMTSFFRAL